jgi:choline dehydrogenase
MSELGEAAEYDYVVVGGGSAGCVVAARLSESGRSSVLLLEAGGSDRKLRFMIPASILQLQLSGDCNWAYPAEPDPSRNNRADGWAAGKVLGGSGSINGMVWVRGHPGDFDQWVAQGCTGWDYKTVAEYFKRCETYESGGDDRYRGRSGPVAVRKNRFNHALTTAFISAAQAAGHEYNDDYNGATQEGVAHTQLNIGKGLRASTSRTYLRRARQRRNFTLRLRASVIRVIFENKRAVGVEFREEGRTTVVRCRREVILSGGAIASPKLLMLSGIGPAQHLLENGIPVIHDSPAVGQNLADHIAASLSYQVNVPSLNTYFTPRRMIRAAAEWALFRDGPLAAGPAHASLHGRWGSSSISQYEIHLLPFALPGLEKGRSVAKLVDNLMAYSALTLVLLSLHPRARGDVSLRSANPDDPPFINYVQLGDPEDIAAVIRAAETARRITEQSPLKHLVVREINPGLDVQSHDEWVEFLRGHSHRGLHMCGTCAMGSGQSNVVDPQLRVRGVEGLRVIDASIMPSLPSGNSNAATIMVGERGVAFVLGQ